ncbi:MAG: ATP-dependent Clp protease proteolytic subunit [Cyanophyceae cyanobacterium]
MNSPFEPDIPINLPLINKTEQAFDIYSRLLEQRIVFLRGELTEATANQIIAQLLFLNAESERDIFLYINSSGGSVAAAIAIHDTLQQLHAEVCTVCVGAAALGGALLLSSGTKGKRYALPNARIRMQQPAGNAQGRATDLEIAVQEILSQRETVNRIFAANTGRSVELIEHDTQREFFLNAKEAKAYSLIDQIITKPPASG